MNFETPYLIGRLLRMRDWDGGDGRSITGAMEWFDRATKLNSYHGYAFLEHGMCLDWLGQTEQARPYFDQAVRLDPNGYFTAAWMGWHYVQTGDYAAAGVWFDRSQRLWPHSNLIASSYRPIVTERMLEAASPLLLPRGQ